MIRETTTAPAAAGAWARAQELAARALRRQRSAMRLEMVAWPSEAREQLGAEIDHLIARLEAGEVAR